MIFRAWLSFSLLLIVHNYQLNLDLWNTFDATFPLSLPTFLQHKMSAARRTYKHSMKYLHYLKQEKIITLSHW